MKTGEILYICLMFIFPIILLTEHGWGFLGKYQEDKAKAHKKYRKVAIFLFLALVTLLLIRIVNINLIVNILAIEFMPIVAVGITGAILVKRKPQKTL